MTNKFIGTIYVDGQRFTHSNFLTGVADTTKAKVVKSLRSMAEHNLEYHIQNAQTGETVVI